jgi:Tfp pilus assembly protein PilX
MKKKDIIVASEQGSIILMTLLIFSIVSILILLIMQLSAQEMHMSEYYFRSQQAQQLADAILEQRCAEIVQVLKTDYNDSQTIPELPLGWREKCTNITTGSGEGQCQTDFLDIKTGPDYCSYKIKCVGYFENASKKIETIVTIHFEDSYNTSREFLYRTYTDNGVIASYKILYN